uniref:Uncharacterized protein n=1 Tax=Phlebotomus papatasi TaxID=29031 RepID=A0A1B0GMB6_PHLPP
MHGKYIDLRQHRDYMEKRKTLSLRQTRLLPFFHQTISNEILWAAEPPSTELHTLFACTSPKRRVCKKEDSYDSYYDRRYDDGRDLFERRYSGMGAMRGGGGSGSGLGGGRDFGGMGSMGRREPLPPLPSLGRSGSGGGSLGSMRGSLSGGNGAGYDSMFSRRSPPRGGSNGMNRFGIYEDFSRDSFDDRRPGMRGPSPTHRYAPY